MIQAREESAEIFLDRSRKKLEETFGFQAFRRGQERVLGAVAAGRDALVIMPTGSGKSLCYQIPALVLPGVTVVVSPLIALMKDQVDGLAMRGVAATFVNSSLSSEEHWERLELLAAREYKIVYVAPERFRSAAFRSALGRVEVSLLAVDEAHCISQWGHDFRPDYRKLRQVRAMLGEVPVLALTATATPEVQSDIVRELDMRDPERVVTGFDRPNLSLQVKKLRGKSRKLEELRGFILQVMSRSSGAGLPAGIVYTGTRRNAELVADELNAGGWLPESPSPGDVVDRPRQRKARCRAYHAGLAPEERREVQEDFMEGRLPWVVATNAFGMGVDKSDIRFVVHYEMPGSLEAYYQEVGRAGRDGQRSDCLLLFAEADRWLQEFFIEGSNPGRKTIEAVYDFLLGLGEHPIFRTLNELESIFKNFQGGDSNPLVFRSTLAILERAGALARLDHHENLAEVVPTVDLPWPENPYSSRATVKSALYQALLQVFQQNGGEPANISLERWAPEMELTEESLRRGLAQLAGDGLIRYVPPFRGRAIQIPPCPGPLSEGLVDFEALERRRQRDMEQLEEIMGFARSRSCRRDIILRHFGESVPETGCGICDGCRSEAPRELTTEEMLAVRMVLSGVARTRGRCGKRRVVQMLRGSSSEAITSLGFHRLSTHGILAEYRQDELREILDLLESVGCVKLSGDKFPVVHLTEQGVKVMKNEEKPELAFPRRESTRGRTVAAGRREKASAEGEELQTDQALFEKLRILRRKIADELGVPAYRVFNDRTLKVMGSDQPQDEESLLQIPGVGAVTLERFGGRFLQVICSHKKEKSIPGAPVETS